MGRHNSCLPRPPACGSRCGAPCGSMRFCVCAWLCALSLVRSFFFMASTHLGPLLRGQTGLDTFSSPQHALLGWLQRVVGFRWRRHAGHSSERANRESLQAGFPVWRELQALCAWPPIAPKGWKGWQRTALQASSLQSQKNKRSKGNSCKAQAPTTVAGA